MSGVISGGRARLLVEPRLNICPAVPDVPANLDEPRADATVTPLLQGAVRLLEVLGHLGRAGKAAFLTHNSVLLSRNRARCKHASEECCVVQ